MESNWRWNLVDLDWAWSYFELCASLVTPIGLDTHVVKNISQIPNGMVIRFREYPDGQLYWDTSLGNYPGSFPYGFVVEPDST